MFVMTGMMTMACTTPPLFHREMRFPLGLLIVLEAGRVLASLAAIICGHVARRQIRKADGREKGKGIALAGLICGYLWVLAPLALALFILLVLIGMSQMSFG